MLAREADLRQRRRPAGIVPRRCRPSDSRYARSTCGASIGAAAGAGLGHPGLLGEYTDRIQPRGNPSTRFARSVRCFPCYPDDASPSRLTPRLFRSTIPGRERSHAHASLFAIICLSSGRSVRRRSAQAQYSAPPAAATAPPARRYHVERQPAHSGIRRPTSSSPASSSGSIGDQRRLRRTRWASQTRRFKQLKMVLRPATKHKFRFSTPIELRRAESRSPASFVFNGQRFDVGIPGHDRA